MIFDFILAVMRFLIDGVTALLPSYTVFPAGLAVQIASFMSYINGWSWLLPISTIISIFGILVLVVFVEFIYFVAMYTLSMIHASIRG